jgi:putative SOS response-associated peptidase YedK
MCGRYANTRSAADLAALFDAVDEVGLESAPDYNVAPTDPVPIVRRSDRMSSRVLSLARWGLVPPWSTDPSVGGRMINARAESVLTSRAYSGPVTRRRCLVPADGWYEWLRTGAGKQPYFMTRRDGDVLAFAGVWTAWGEGAAHRLTFSVLTLAAAGELAGVHDRMPLVLEPARWAAWLTAADPAPLLAPAPAAYLAGIELRPVSAAVGNVRNDGPELIQRVPAAPLPSPVENQPATLF